MAEAKEKEKASAKLFMYSMMVGMLITGSANTLI